jgi:hypothetical protein
MGALRWKKDPPDGTSYVYWVAPGGWVIETKPRFLPNIGYLLLPPPAEFGAGHGVSCRRLCDAKAVAQWPREKIVEALRNEYQYFLTTWCAADPIGTMMAHAIEEDAERARNADFLARKRAEVRSAEEQRT